jgi:hypothetical protein
LSRFGKWRGQAGFALFGQYCIQAFNGVIHLFLLSCARRRDRSRTATRQRRQRMV